MAANLRRQIQGLRRIGKVPVKSTDARERLLESVFLNGVTEFESFLEEVFFAAVSNRVRPGTTRPIVGLRNPQTARSLILRPRENYLKWLPYEQSQERADQYLHDGWPFARLTARTGVIKRLDDTMVVRNAVAHKSGSAHRKFQDATQRKYSTPGQYLAASLGKSTVCDAFLADFVRYGKALCVSDAEASKLLGPKGPYPSGKKVPAGQYECLGCGTVYSLPRREALVCATCDLICRACGSPTSRNAEFRPS